VGVTTLNQVMESPYFAVAAADDLGCRLFTYCDKYSLLFENQIFTWSIIFVTPLMIVL
jgi:hypothetical protein